MSNESEIAVERNRKAYETFWEEAPDFSRYNPGARHRRRLIVRAVERLAFDSFLDVGCGDGELIRTIRALRPSARASGADVASAQVERNRARFRDVDFYTLDIQGEALDRTFDLVVCSEVIEHVARQSDAIAHLAAMVAPGGSLIVTCPTGTLYATEKRFGHVRHATEEELQAYARDAGLRVVDVLNWGFPLYRLLKWATNVNAEWALRRFASGRYSTSSKMISNTLYWVNHLNVERSRHGCQLVAIFGRP